MEKTTSPFIKYLQKIVQDHPNTIEHAVATWLLSYDTPEHYLTKLLEQGCQHGIVPTLNYYRDTYLFFDTHYRQIVDLYYQYNVTIPAQTDIKNYLAWWSFETVARSMYNKARLFY
ncbi:MAG: DUF7222 domain-containing protein [Aureispira sp.]